MDSQLSMIFDRTQSDVDRVSYLQSLWVNGTFTGTTAELAEWASDLKGAYNAADLNRVTAAMDYLNDYFLSLGYHTGYQPITVPHQSTSPLPDGYTQLEYIQSSGTQYIDTGFKPDQNTRVVADVDFGNDSATMSAFGAWNSSNQGAFIHAGTSDNLKQVFFYGNARCDISVGKAGRHLIDFNKNQAKIDTTSATATTQTFSCNYNMLLLAYNNAGTSANMADAKLYSCKVYDNGTLIRDYIPCKNPLNITALYDTVNGQFYANAGSGTFVAGPEVENAPKDPTLWYEDDIPTQTIMKQYISNVEALRSRLPLPPDTPQTPDDMECLTYQEANAIEKILYTLESVLIAMEEAFLLRQANTLFMIAGGVFNG